MWPTSRSTAPAGCASRPATRPTSSSTSPASGGRGSGAAGGVGPAPPLRRRAEVVGEPPDGPCPAVGGRLGVERVGTGVAVETMLGRRVADDVVVDGRLLV